MDEFHRNMDINTSAMYLNYAATRAFAFWLDVVSSLYISAVMFSFLMIKKDGKITKVLCIIIIVNAEEFMSLTRTFSSSSQAW